MGKDGQRGTASKTSCHRCRHYCHAVSLLSTQQTKSPFGLTFMPVGFAKCVIKASRKNFPSHFPWNLFILSECLSKYMNTYFHVENIFLPQIGGRGDVFTTNIHTIIIINITNANGQQNIQEDVCSVSRPVGEDTPCRHHDGQTPPVPKYFEVLDVSVRMVRVQCGCHKNMPSNHGPSSPAESQHWRRAKVAMCPMWEQIED